MANCILATMRDEAPFLLEWVAYHRAIGFDRIVVYSNDCTDGTDQMLDTLHDAGIVEHMPHKPSARTPVARVVAADAMRRSHFDLGDWVIWLDADEFLNIHLGDGRVSDLVDAMGEATGICMSWRLFGDSGQSGIANGLISADFTQCAKPGDGWASVKTLFKHTDSVIDFFQHRPTMCSKFWDDGGFFLGGNGQPLSPSSRQSRMWREGQRRSKVDGADAGWGWAQINHYAVRTPDHFLAKRARGRIAYANMGGPERYDDHYYSSLNKNEDNDTSILRWADATRAAQAELEELVELELSGTDTQRYQTMHQSHGDKLDERRHANGILAQAIVDVLSPVDAIDIGCGIGVLMAELLERSVDATGVEGLWLEDSAVVCSPERFQRVDLENAFDLGRRYDLCLSIEVAEHLETERAPGFVADLCRLSDAVVFSAAIPGQGGKGHKNEQWQSYWAAYFADHGYAPYDAFRPGFWKDTSLLPWFRQNVILYLKEGHPLGSAMADVRLNPQACNMILPEYHQKVLRRARQMFKKKLVKA